jgi:NADP-dependent 3-hydroxy acid dehydrogenase YdfG
MGTEFCFITAATCGIDSEIAKSALVGGNQAVATNREAEAVAKAQGASNKFLPVTPDVTSEESARTWLVGLFSPVLVDPCCAPSIAFTPNGPLVYEWETSCC